MESARNIKSVIGLASTALKADAGQEPDIFLEAVAAYLSALELWQKEVVQESPLSSESPLSEGDKSALRGDIERLTQIHQQLLERAGSTKDEVGVRMGELHKRASGLKKYVDTLPARITIAGKREG